MVGASQAQARSKHFEVITDIELILADRVSLETSGLTGRLVGNIRVRSGQDEMTRGTGELSIVEGKYTAYGRKLDIQHGRLIFTGGPVADPGVDIRAVKQFPEVVAGVNVRGTLLQPRLSFFSEPSLPQSQILSLILAGGSLSAGTEGSDPADQRRRRAACAGWRNPRAAAGPESGHRRCERGAEPDQ